MTPILLLVALVIAVGVVAYLSIVRLRAARHERDTLKADHEATLERFKSIIDVEAERDRVLRELAEQREKAETELAAGAARYATQQHEVDELQRRIAALTEEFESLDEEANLRSFGVYEPHYVFETADEYAARLDEVREQQKSMIKSETAASCSITWTVNGSEAEGRKQIKQTLKLMLRAFNGECDAAIAKVRYNNVGVMETRIRKAYDAINALAKVQSSTISNAYLDLRLNELFLAHEYQEKLQSEKEEQRRIREQMREEEQALREIEKARADAEKEERRYDDALAKARAELANSEGKKHDALNAQIAELERKLAEAHQNKERAMSRAQMTKSGHVYVISNIGAFGEQVFKIGMTRRLEPLDRIKELGDASVPFDFDVHALIYSEDAPRLENALHKKFHSRRVNRVNERREFFNVSVEEIAEVVRAEHGDIQFTLAAEAVEYRKTLAIRELELQEVPSATISVRLPSQARAHTHEAAAAMAN